MQSTPAVAPLLSKTPKAALGSNFIAIVGSCAVDVNGAVNEHGNVIKTSPI